MLWTYSSTTETWWETQWGVWSATGGWRGCRAWGTSSRRWRHTCSSYLTGRASNISTTLSTIWDTVSGISILCSSKTSISSFQSWILCRCGKVDHKTGAAPLLQDEGSWLLSPAAGVGGDDEDPGFWSDIPRLGPGLAKVYSGSGSGPPSRGASSAPAQWHWQPWETVPEKLPPDYQGREPSKLTFLWGMEMLKWSIKTEFKSTIYTFLFPILNRKCKRLSREKYSLTVLVLILMIIVFWWSFHRIALNMFERNCQRSNAAADVGKHVTDILKSDDVFFPPYTRYQ